MRGHARRPRISGLILRRGKLAMLNYDKTDNRILAALDVVAKYDPELYRRMMRDDWTLTFRKDDLPPDVKAAFDDPSFGAMGVTQSKSCEGVPDATMPGRTTLNDSMLKAGARKLSVPVHYLAAMTVVHEYEHIGQEPCA